MITPLNYNKGSEWNRWDLHVHTVSSYDYDYKGTDADELLCSTLTDNNIVAVAITDHFLIDSEKIIKLRSLAPNIIFFPGVELRTDKGAKNLHLILVFSEKMDVKTLSDDFNAIMIRQKAMSSSKSDETIYWTFEDIIEFAKEHKALVSIHAGRKSNGIDKEITNALPVKEAIKEDIAKDIHFFEVGKIEDITDYYEHIFKIVEEKPIIMCSDNHDPRNYNPKEKLWIKAKPTFEGLL
jgi:histidinol phosphatase-like PHP family hydrolase